MRQGGLGQVLPTRGGFATGAEDEARGESGQHWGLKYCPTYLLDGRGPVERLAAQMADGFDEAHALIVRPSNSRLLDHQRSSSRACRRQAGFNEVLCWVREMADRDDLGDPPH